MNISMEETMVCLSHVNGGVVLGIMSFPFPPAAGSWTSKHFKVSRAPI